MYDYFINLENLKLTAIRKQQSYSFECTETVSKSYYIWTVNEVHTKTALKKIKFIHSSRNCYITFTPFYVKQFFAEATFVGFLFVRILHLYIERT
jgi:hypothetical protein